jgi:four helix bundle protein
MNGQTGKRANGQSLRNVVSDFRSQILWQKAQAFGAAIAEVVVALPRDRAADAIAGQLIRSATSIAANIAEGYGRFSQAAYRSHLSVARGSAFETMSWLDLLARRHYLTDEACAPLIAQCVELQKLLTIRMRSLSAGKTYAISEEAATYEV